MMLSHPHIIEYVHHELSERQMRIFTEYCESKDLESVLGERSRYESTAAVESSWPMSPC